MQRRKKTPSRGKSVGRSGARRAAGAAGAEPAYAGGAEAGPSGSAERPGRRVYTDAEKRSLVEELACSGETMTAFAKARGVSRATLSKWRKELESGGISHPELEGGFTLGTGYTDSPDQGLYEDLVTCGVSGHPDVLAAMKEASDCINLKELELGRDLTPAEYTDCVCASIKDNEIAKRCIGNTYLPCGW